MFGEYLVPGTWYLVPGTWYLVPGTWYLVPGTWYLVPGTIPVGRTGRKNLFFLVIRVQFRFNNIFSSLPMPHPLSASARSGAAT